ncbi:MAG: SDR family oxidoreductase [Clostridia bacterium]|nr:SDR family oxidoreductase [Clostridia bacterium]
MKTILISGASGGIGSEIAKTLAKKNNNLVLIYNKNKPKIEKLKKHCSVELFQCDLTNTEQIKIMIEKIIKKHKKIDVLINCAGISKFQQIQDTSDDDYYEIFDNNLKSTIMLTSAVSKHMISEKKGNIVNISSMWGVVGSSMESLYSASKGAINTFSLSLAKELGPSNINVNAICPGLIDTKMNKSLSKETIQEIVENTPIGRIGKPKDVASLVEFLVSEKASFITGQIITIDGGFTL